MIERKFVYTLTWMLAVILAGLLLINNFNVSWGFFKPISTLASIGLLIIGCFEKFVWKWRLLYPWFVSTPNISGTWKGYLISDYQGDVENSQPEKIEAYVVVQQTFSTIQIKLVTKESSSELISGKLYETKGNFSIAGIYINFPKQLYKNKSEIHHGGLIFNIGKNGAMLEGFYWTDRKTRGDLYFDTRIKNTYSNFESCEEAFISQQC